MLQYNSNLSRVMEQETILKNGRNSKSQMSRGNKKQVLGIAFACVVILFCVNFTFKSPVNSENNIDQIIGVWKIVSTGVPENVKTQKIITKEHFILTMTIDNVIVSSFGGTCSFDGKTYIEKIEFGTQNRTDNIGQKGEYKIRFEGKKMYLSGQVSGPNRVPFSEIWERVE